MHLICIITNLHVVLKLLQVDFTALLYLSALSLPAAVQFMLDAEKSFGADPTLTSSLHQELSSFHTICHHLEAIEAENEIRAKFLNVFDKPECDQGLESQGQVTFEGQTTSEETGISEGHAVLKGHGTSISSEFLLCSSSSRQDAKAVEQSTVGTLEDTAVQSALPQSSVQSGEQECGRIPHVLETCDQVGKNSQERSVLEDSDEATTILEPPSQTLTSRLSQKSSTSSVPSLQAYQLHSPGQIDETVCFPSDTAVSSDRQLWNSVQTGKSISGTSDCPKEEATEIVIVPCDSHTSQPTTSSADDDHHADIVKPELPSIAVVTNTAKATTSASEADEGRVKVNVSSTRVEVTSMIPSEVAPVSSLEKMADSKSIVTDLMETEPVFIPNLQHLCIGSRCFEGHGNLSLGVACLDRCLSANSALCSLIILCSESSPDINMVSSCPFSGICVCAHISFY